MQNLNNYSKPQNIPKPSITPVVTKAPKYVHWGLYILILIMSTLILSGVLFFNVVSQTFLSDITNVIIILLILFFFGWLVEFTLRYISSARMALTGVAIVSIISGLVISFFVLGLQLITRSLQGLHEEGMGVSLFSQNLITQLDPLFILLIIIIVFNIMPIIKLFKEIPRKIILWNSIISVVISIILFYVLKVMAHTILMV